MSELKKDGITYIDFEDIARIIAERDALQAKLVTAEHMAFDYRNERDAYMQSYDNVCKERDALQAKLQIAVEALKYYTNYRDRDRHVAVEALKKLKGE